MDGGQRHSRRRSSLPTSSVLQSASTSASASTPTAKATSANVGAPLQIRNVPAPLPTPAPSTPPASSGLRVPSGENNVEMISRPPTPGPSPTLDAKFPELYLRNEAGEEGGHIGDVLLEKGKARARDGELVGPDLRRESSVDENNPSNLLLRFQRFDKSQRAKFLSALLNDLELNEAVTLSRRIEPRLRRDFLKELPLELALHAMSFIDEARTLGRAAQVSRHWNHLFSDEQTWKEIYDRHRGMSHTGFIPPANSPFLHYGPHFRGYHSGSAGVGAGAGGSNETNSTAGSGSEAGRSSSREGRMPPDEMRKRAAISALGAGTAGFTNALGRRPFAERASSGSFKQQFKNAYITESNWLHGGHVLANHIPAEEGPVTTLSMNERYVAIGMANSRIHVFDITTGRLKRHLLGHEAGVWALGLITKNPIADPNYKSSFDLNGLKGEARSSSSMGMGSGASTATDMDMDMDVDMDVDMPNGMEDPYQARRASFNTSASTADRTGFGIMPGMGFVGGDREPPRRPSTATGHGPSRPQREARKMKSSDVCGSALGWPGLRKDLAVSGGSDKALRVWDIETGRCLHTLLGHRSTLRCLKMLEGRPICVTGSRDSTVRVWDIEKGRMLHNLRGHSTAVRCLEVAGNQIVSGSYDHTCRLWDADTGECLHVLSGHFGEIYAVAFDGIRIVAGSADSTVRVWSADTGQCLALLQGHTSLVGQLQLTDDILTTGGSDGRIIVFNLATMQCLERLCAHDNSVTCLQFDQRFILSGGNDGRAKVWDMQTGRFLRELTVACEAVWRVAFKDDRAVVLCQRDRGTTALEIISFRPEDERVKPRWNPNVDRVR